MYDSVIQDQIDREVRECQFFSIQVDETTNILNGSKFLLFNI